MIKQMALDGRLVEKVSACARTIQTLFFHDGIMDIVFQEDFYLISESDLPLAIQDAVNTYYNEHTIQSVFKNDLNEYKVEVQLDNHSQFLFFDENGNSINEK